MTKALKAREMREIAALYRRDAEYNRALWKNTGLDYLLKEARELDIKAVRLEVRADALESAEPHAFWRWLFRGYHFD